MSDDPNRPSWLARLRARLGGEQRDDRGAGHATGFLELTPIERKRHEEGLRRMERYGLEVVRGAAVSAALDRIAGAWLAERGLASRRDRARVAPLDDGRFLLLQPCAFKGKQWAVRWGVSLPFLPHAVQPRPAFHRTVASARFDLFCTGAEGDWWNREDGHDGFIVDGLHGDRCMEVDLVRVWRESAPGIAAWLDRARTLEGIAALAEAQASRPSIHHPQPLLVLAFVRARLGDRAGADTAFAKWARGRADDPDVEPMRALLATSAA